MLENETFEFFFAKSLKEEGRGGSENSGKKSAISDEMHWWMTLRALLNFYDWEFFRKIAAFSRYKFLEKTKAATKEVFCKKKLFLKISQYSQENTCIEVSL